MEETVSMVNEVFHESFSLMELDDDNDDDDDDVAGDGSGNDWTLSFWANSSWTKDLIKDLMEEKKQTPSRKHQFSGLEV